MKGMDCLTGMFSGCFNEELCFRCWDVIFLEQKRNSQDMMGYLACIGIALCNQYRITTKSEWEVLGKYYMNFSEVNRMSKDTYWSLLGDEENYNRWVYKQQQSEQLRADNMEKYEMQRQLIQSYVNKFELNFDGEAIECLIQEEIKLYKQQQTVSSRNKQSKQCLHLFIIKLNCRGEDDDNLNKENESMSRQFTMDVQGNDISGDDYSRIEKYISMEWKQGETLLRFRVKIDSNEYEIQMDVRGFNSNTMYNQVVFLQENSSANQILCEFSIYLEKYSEEVLRNDLCVNSNFTNAPVTRVGDFERYYNSQMLLESGIKHFVFSKNILTRTRQSHPISSLGETMFSFIETTKREIFLNLLNDLGENDVIEVLQFLLLFTPLSYQRKLTLLFDLFCLRFPEQTSDDLESYLLDFCLKTDMSFLSIRDFQLLLHSHVTQDYQIYRAVISLDGDIPNDVTDMFLQQIMNPICDVYLLHNIDISQSFIVETILAQILPQAHSNSKQAKYTRRINQEQQGTFSVFYFFEGKPVEKKITFFISSTDPLSIEVLHPENDIQELVTHPQQRKVQIAFSQFRDWINLKPYVFIDNRNVFSRYSSRIGLLETHLMKHSPFVHPTLPLCKTPPIILRVSFQQSTELYIDEIFTSSTLHSRFIATSSNTKTSPYNSVSKPMNSYDSFREHSSQPSINYLSYLTLDDSLVGILQNILQLQIKFIKKYIKISIDQVVIPKSAYDLPLSNFVSKNSLQNSLNVVSIALTHKNVLETLSLEKKQLSWSPPSPHYSFHGYSLWKICSHKCYLPCKISSPQCIKYKKQQITYINTQNIVRWYNK